MLKEFREFIAKGNVLDLAVGVIIGAAFGKIVDSFVKDIIMPPIGLLTGGIDFSQQFLVMKEGSAPGPYPSMAAATEAGAVTLNYGSFINTLISFLIISFAIFMVVKAANKMRKQEEAAPAGPSNEEVLLAEIRDLLKAKA